MDKYSGYIYYSVDDAEKTQKLRKKYVNQGISALEGQNAPIDLDEYVISSHIQSMKDLGFDLPNNALLFGRTFCDDGSYIYYGVGGFDCWCVFLKYKDEYGWKEVVPLDREYFTILKHASIAYGVETVWEDFWKVYLRTDSKINTDVFREIHEISQKYKPALLMEQTLSIIYLAMIAEENKILRFDKYGKPIMTKLGKMIKALGVYQVLFEDMDPEQAASFSKNPEGGWKALDNLCAEHGITRIYK